MNATSPRRQVGGFTAIGILLLAAGVLGLAAGALDIDPFAAAGGNRWPLLVIVPGLVLLGASVFPTPPNGLGFAIPGAIVTTVGLVLTYQQATGHWQSWAYAWALVGPGAAGVAMLLYGLVFRDRPTAIGGARLALIGATLFGIGAWYFETIFRTGEVPVDLGSWWPFVVIAVGLVALVAGLRTTAGDEVGAQPPTGVVR
jgi:hypothetical protein